MRPPRKPDSLSCIWPARLAWLLLYLSLSTAGWADDTPPPLTMRVALERVFQMHPALRAARHRVEASEAWARGAGAQPNPQLRLSVPAGDPSEEANSLVQRLEIAGQPGLRSRIAERQVEQADARMQMQQRELAVRTIDAYYGLWAAQAIERLQIARVELARELQRGAERRLELGQIAETEALRTRLEAARAEAQLAQAQGDLRIARVRLNLLLQRPPEEHIMLTDNPAKANFWELTEEPLPQMNRADVLQGAAQRPDVRSAELGAEVAHMEADLAGRQNWPDFEFEAYRSNLGARAEQGLRFSLVLPLWDWGHNRAVTERKEKEALVADDEAALTRLNAQEQVLEAWELFRVAGERRQLLHDQVQRYLRQAELTQRGYEAGLLSLVEVLEAQRAYRDAMLEFVAAETALQKRGWEVYWLSGGPVLAPGRQP